ncbi:hypothetical protein DPMN_045557 [Dreissena polymorpha]|uniref:Uncharacterized protein n=1 Tax=Dreissena polymorpha TaxID=45954 RepID=A0A9D4D676_DREPO|nr:hypothetical protein DPMN_045557 [Dreissena polymorpha]
MEEYPGPYCQQQGISTHNLKTGDSLCSEELLSNGVVLEINTYLEKVGKNSQDIYHVLSQLDPSIQDTVNVKSLKIKISRINEQKKKLVSKKKVPGVKNVQELLDKQFLPPQTTARGQVSQQPNAINEEKLRLSPLTERCGRETESEIVHTRSVGVQTDIECDQETLKETNLLQYNNAKKQKHSSFLQSKIMQQKDLLQSLNERVGHYSVRDVNKRDETARKNLHLLRHEQRVVCRQSKLLVKSAEKI